MNFRDPTIAEKSVLYKPFLVVCPCSEDFCHVQVVGEVLAAVLGKVGDKVGLEVDLLMAVGQLLVPGHPPPPVLVHGFLVGKANIPQNMLDEPQSHDVKHGVGVVLVLHSTSTASIKGSQDFIIMENAANMARVQVSHVITVFRCPITIVS